MVVVGGVGVDAMTRLGVVHDGEQEWRYGSWIGNFLTKKAMYIFTIPSLFGYNKKKADLVVFRFPQ